MEIYYLSRDVLDEYEVLFPHHLSFKRTIIFTYEIIPDLPQVIVANQDGIDSAKKSHRFEYRSGSIENDRCIYKLDGTVDYGVFNLGVQQHICDILEGGISAFEKRKNKYHI